MDFEAIKAAAQGYQADMTRFLREMISHPSESCEEKEVVHCIKAEMEKLGYDKVEIDGLGNVIGSNIFNIFFVLGCTSTIMPLQFGNINGLDLLVLTGASVLFWATGWFFGHRTIKRSEGAAMVGLYIAYIAYLIAQSGAV